MSTPHIDPDSLFERGQSESESPFGRQLIDVRRPDEFVLGHAVGAVSVPLHELSRARLEEVGVDPTDPIYFICRSGKRSLMACLLLASEGWTTGVNVTGGTLAWVEAGLPTHRPDPA